MQKQMIVTLPEELFMKEDIDIPQQVGEACERFLLGQDLVLVLPDSFKCELKNIGGDISEVVVKIGEKHGIKRRKEFCS